MKKKTFLCLIIFGSLLTACSSKNNMAVLEDTTINSDAIDKTTNLETTNTIKNTETKTERIADIDVTSLSSTMLAAELFNVQYNMPDYVGQTIRMEGQYTEYEDPYHDCTIHVIYAMDEGGCCPIEFEIMLPDGENYPQENDTIEIFGKISSDTRMSTDGKNANNYYYIETSEIENIENGEKV